MASPSKRWSFARRCRSELDGLHGQKPRRSLKDLDCLGMSLKQGQQSMQSAWHDDAPDAWINEDWVVSVLPCTSVLPTNRQKN